MERDVTTVIICGSRDFVAGEWASKKLDVVHAKLYLSHVIEGGAKGADAIGRAWAEGRRIRCTTYKADWDKHGPSAGPIRNREMLMLGKPDYVIAMPGGVGTAHMVAVARERGVPVIFLAKVSTR